jgi:molybdate transport system regulatory protein
MGPGKADLLTAIQETGSIAAAGRKLGMSYQKTRHLVDEMNLCFASPLVEGFKGGAQGGGAKLTDLGQEVLHRYLVMQSQAEKAVSEELDRFQAYLAP